MSAAKPPRKTSSGNPSAPAAPRKGSAGAAARPAAPGAESKAVAPATAKAQSLAQDLEARQTRPGRRFHHWVVLHALGIGIGLSVWAHGLLPIIGFSLPEPTIKKARDPGLAVVLVNARHRKPPKEAQALAQANLDGGGDTADKKAMPSSPLPPQESRKEGDALLDMQKKVQQLEAQQKELLRKAKGPGLAVAEQREARNGEQVPDPTPTSNGLDLNNAAAIARQEAVVSKGLRDYAARPRKGTISPRTQEYELAQYGEDWRIRVERVGEYNFPRGTKGSLYGSVQISVEIGPNGELISAEITRPDPRTPQINEAALNIVKKASPFAKIPPEVRKKYDTLVITRTLNFTRDDITATGGN